MKKNILLVQSLLILPLVSSSIIISMNTETPVTKTPLTNSRETPKERGQKRASKKLKKNDEKALRNRMNQVLVSLDAHFKKETPVIPTNQSISKQNELEASVYQPVQPTKKGLSWTEWGQSKLNLIEFILNTIKEKNFDPANADHMRALHDAAKELAQNKDTAGLQNLLQACRTNYPNIQFGELTALKIRNQLNDHKESINKEYAQQITFTTEQLKQRKEDILTQNISAIKSTINLLEANNKTLWKLSEAYTDDTNGIVLANKPEITNMYKSQENFSKLYRKIPKNKETSSIYLDNNKKIESAKEDIYLQVEALHKTQKQLERALSQLTKSEKPATLQLTDK